MTAVLDLAARLLRLLPAETAHRLTIRSLAIAPAGWIGGRQSEDHILATRVFGLDFPNPIGLAAGFDKNAEAFAHMPAIGFGFAEIGSVTPRPQPGNPRPRLFRLTPDQAIVNRLGFNNDGLEAVAARLRRTARRGILGANLGKNKDSADAAADYVAGVKALAPLADYLVVNVSSPNTPGLRALQGREPLAELLAAVGAARQGSRPPLLLKIAPDLTEADKSDIAEVALAGGVDGLIVTNTTIARPAGLAGPAAQETGGLSGRPLFAPSTAVLADIYRLTGGRLPLIGVGGIASAEDAYAKIRAGASLLQLYTALVYQGPGLVERIKRGLAARLRADGFARLADAVGADHATRYP
ncbi:MAG TPA: quinone-dependent dihydroorotate dehydrogenase [Verrucomicrobiae bacterium]|jgi:dihydroorotate dehydrogenase|nr:quinone-dependent dihydroorotate dehydrogenase [Verrucomicrobiae bacterium]